MDKEKIKEILKEKNMSISDLAKKSNLSTATISRILTGKRRNPQIDTVKKIASALGIDIKNVLESDRNGNKNIC